MSSASRPIENNAVRIETTVTIGNKNVLCMGTHVYKAGQGEEDAQGDTLDPGLVMTGTKCDVDSVRLDMYNYMYSCHTLIFLAEIRQARRVSTTLQEPLGSPLYFIGV